MESRVKERLVGAAILVGLVVILVPEMLSGPHETEVGPPGADGPLQTYTIDLTNPGAQPKDPDPPPEKQQLSLDPDPARQKSDSPPAAQAPGSQSPPQQVTPPPAAASSTSPPKQSGPPPATPPPAPPKKPATGGWAVQIGSFAKPDNAKRLTVELTAKGYDAFIVTTGSGANTRHKVRVGPQETRADADRLAARLKKEGRQVAVVSNK